jgi:hypothetical protein
MPAAKWASLSCAPAGQPDRKVKVVKSTKLEDGRTVSEMKYFNTGEMLLVSIQKAKQPKPMPKATMLIEGVKPAMPTML